jgi:uncharacterized protein (TIGR00725 family)
MRRKLTIAVVGQNECSEETAQTAALIGRTIAQKKGVVICGGLGGVMEAAARGAKEAGGVTVGILPTMNKNDANQYIDLVIPTGLGDARNVLVARAADAMIALPGKYGTLSEIAFALMAGIPVVSVSSWVLGADVHQVENPLEAVEMAMDLAAKRLA